MIFPVPAGGTVLANWTSISSGSFILTMGGFTFTISSLDFSAAGSLGRSRYDYSKCVSKQKPAAVLSGQVRLLLIPRLMADSFGWRRKVDVVTNPVNVDDWRWWY